MVMYQEVSIWSRPGGEGARRNLRPQRALSLANLRRQRYLFTGDWPTCAPKSANGFKFAKYVEAGLLSFSTDDFA